LAPGLHPEAEGIRELQDEDRAGLRGEPAEACGTQVTKNLFYHPLLTPVYLVFTRRIPGACTTKLFALMRIFHPVHNLAVARNLVLILLSNI
jgi:hypothetical protein